MIEIRKLAPGSAKDDELERVCHGVVTGSSKEAVAIARELLIACLREYRNGDAEVPPEFGVAVGGTFAPLGLHGDMPELHLHPVNAGWGLLGIEDFAESLDEALEPYGHAIIDMEGDEFCYGVGWRHRLQAFAASLTDEDVVA